MLTPPTTVYPTSVGLLSKHVIQFLGSSFLYCCALATFASDNQLEAIDVNADEIEDTGDVVHSEFTGSHTNLTTEQLQRVNANLADVISFETGVQSQQLGGFGTLSNLTLRASTAAQTGVYLNGIKLNGAVNAGVDLSMLDMLNLSSVDIYRGSTPMQLGSASIGGAVNLKTLQPNSNSNETKLQVASGSFGMYRTQIAHQSSVDRWNLLGSLSHLTSDNNFTFRSDNTTPLNPNDDRNEHRNNSAVERVSALGHAQYFYNPNHFVDILVQATQRSLGIPEWRNDADNEASFATQGIQLQFSQTINDWKGWNSRHSLFLNAHKDTFDDPLSQVGFGAQDATTDSNTYGFKTYWEKPVNSGTLALTAETRKERLKAVDELDTVGNADASRESLTSIFQYSWISGTEKHTLTPTLQLDLNKNRFDGEIIGLNNSKNNSQLSPLLGYRFQYSKNLSITANTGFYYREPSFYELFGNQGLVLANQELTAERGINVDLGLQRSTPKWATSITLFASERDELIATVFDARGIGRNINSGAASIVGIEVSNEYKFSPKLTGKLNFTTQDAHANHPNPALDGKQIPGQAQTTAYARLQYQTLPWKAYIEFDGAWGRYYDQASLLKAKDQWLQNVGIEWRKEKYSVSASVNNIGDKVVEDYNGYPRPGRIASVNVSFNL